MHRVPPRTLPGWPLRRQQPDAAGDAANEADADYRLLAEAEDAAADAAARNAAAMEAERAAAGDAAISADEFFAVMDRLSPAVREAYAAQEAETGALRDMAAELGPAAESLAEVGLSYREMVEQGILPADSALRGSADAVDATRAAYRDLVDQGIDPVDAAFTAVREHGGGVTEALASAGDAAEAATVPFERVRDDAGDLDTVLRDVGASAPAVAGGLAAAGNAAESSGSGARRAYGWWGLLTKEVTLFGGVLGDAHLIGSVQLWHIALDGLFESAVALGEGLAALTVGIAAMTPTAEDIYTHLQAVHTVTSALGVDIPPVTGKFQALAQAMEPGTLEAYGGALDLINSKGSELAKVAGEVVGGLDAWIAKLDVWKASQASTGALLQNGVGFLHQFEEMLDNVGIAIDNLIKADPGTAHYLMDLVVGFTKVLDVITEIPAPILMAAMGLHSFMLWGGLLFTGLTKLLTPIRAVAVGLGGISAASSAVKNLGEDASGAERLAATLNDIGTGAVSAVQGALQFVRQVGLLGADAEAAVIPMNDLRTAEAGLALESDSLAASFLALAANPFTWIAVAAAALVAVSVAAANAKTSTQQWVASLEQGVNQAKGLQQIGQTYQDLTAVTGALTGAQQQLATATSTSGAVMGSVQGRLDGHLQPRGRDRREQRQRPVRCPAAVVERLRQRGRQRRAAVLEIQGQLR